MLASFMVQLMLNMNVSSPYRQRSALVIFLSTGSSTATSYLTGEVRQRPNLTILTSVHTERVLFTSGKDGATKAVGVQISTTRDGPKFAVSANREILLCGGVIGSPQVLLLSGVGPAEQLQRLNIPVVRDLPAVGWGLLDVRVLP